MLSVKQLKILTTTIILAFIVQEILIHFYISEPYPALRMPPFYGNSINQEGYYQGTSVGIQIDFGKKGNLNLTSREFFYNIPLSHVRSMLRNFSPISDSSKSNSSMEQFAYLKPILPGLIISRSRTLTEIQRDPETLNWLRHQIYKIDPTKKPKKITFLWYVDQYDPENLFNRKREVKGITTIKLNQ